MSKTIYYSGKKIEIGSFIDYLGATIKATDDFIKMNPHLFYFKEYDDSEYMIEVAKRNYPIGTHFKSVTSGKLGVTKKLPEWEKTSNSIYCISDDGDNVTEMDIYFKDKWAEKLDPMLITEDGKQIYRGNGAWWVAYVDRVDCEQYLNYGFNSEIRNPGPETYKYFAERVNAENFILSQLFTKIV